MVEIEDLSVSYPGGRDADERFRALDGVSLSIEAGEVVGLVGESGSGKTTLARLLARLLEPTSGRLTLDGRDVTRLSRAERRSLQRRVQIVFQDPSRALNSYHTAGYILAQSLVVHGLVGGQRESAAGG